MIPSENKVQPPDRMSKGLSVPPRFLIVVDVVAALLAQQWKCEL